MAWWEYINPVVALNHFVYHRIKEGFFPDQPPFVPVGFEQPRVTEGTQIPIIYGRVRVRNPVMVWSGNYLQPGESYTPLALPPRTADHFSFDALFIAGLAFFGGKATLTNIWAGDAIMQTVIDASTGSAQRFSGGPLPPAPADLSLSGTLYQGTTTQSVTATVPTQTDSSLTYNDGVTYGTVASLDSARQFAGVSSTQLAGMRNQTAVYAHIGVGTSPGIPTLSFELRSLSTGTPADMGSSLSDDACPAAVIFDLLTATWGKAGLPRSAINVPSFETASATLASEGNGYSRVIDQGGDVISAINDVLRQIDGVIFEDPETGLITIKLIRADFDPATLDDINPNNCDAPSDGWYSVQGWAELPNRIKLTYTNRADNYASAEKITDNFAGIRASGGRIRAMTVNMQGCSSEALAANLAGRELSVVSRPIVKATVRVDRSFYRQRPGDVVTLTWPELGVNRMVMRVARVDRGKPGSSRITLDLIRDVFGVSTPALP